jgi:hypothetical protein
MSKVVEFRRQPEPVAEARRAELDRRYKKRDRPPVSLGAVRISELRRLYTDRYGRVLPDDDAGRDEAVIMAHHIARRPGDHRRLITAWLSLWAPWMSPRETAGIITTVTANPIRWRADTLATRLNLTEADRRRLRITTIGAVDMTKAERAKRRRERARLRKQRERRSQGAKSRTEYEANSISRNKPWITEGISRRTWYRRRGTSPATA